MKSLFLGLVLSCGLANAAELADDAPLPAGVPVKASVMFCKENIDGRVIILFMGAEYADGTTVHFDGTHSHGLTDTTELFHLLEKAKDFKQNTVSCPLRGNSLSGVQS